MRLVGLVGRELGSKACVPRGTYFDPQSGRQVLPFAARESLLLSTLQKQYSSMRWERMGYSNYAVDHFLGAFVGLQRTFENLFLALS
jgi:hypothetical protein